jgi:hypothetical protein
MRVDYEDEDGNLREMTPDLGSVYFEGIRKDPDSYIRKELPLVRCTEEQIIQIESGAAAEEKLAVDDYLSPPEDLSWELGGNFYDRSNSFSFAKLKIKACRNENGVQCASPAHVDRFRRTGKLKIIYKDMHADLNNISTLHNEPFHPRTEFDYFLPFTPFSEHKANVEKYRIELRKKAILKN